MKALKFKFQNSDLVSKSTKRKFFYSKKITQLILISSTLVFTGFFTLKLFHFLNLKNNLSFIQQSIEEPKPSHIVPLVVNLKGQNGPQLAKVQVYITLLDEENKKNILLQNPKLEKQLLFLLSGQSIQNLKQDQFYNQIQSQLNTLLSDSLVDQIKIKTEILN